MAPLAHDPANLRDPHGELHLRTDRLGDAIAHIEECPCCGSPGYVQFRSTSGTPAVEFRAPPGGTPLDLAELPAAFAASGATPAAPARDAALFPCFPAGAHPCVPVDCGQCNDAYSAIKIAGALAQAFGCGLNDLPLSLILSWCEQKAVCILLTLLSLGIKNIRLGPTLPEFLKPDIIAVLVEKFGLQPTGTVEADLHACLTA